MEIDHGLDEADEVELISGHEHVLDVVVELLAFFAHLAIGLRALDHVQSVLDELHELVEALLGVFDELMLQEETQDPVTRLDALVLLELLGEVAASSFAQFFRLADAGLGGPIALLLLERKELAEHLAQICAHWNVESWPLQRRQLHQNIFHVVALLGLVIVF